MVANCPLKQMQEFPSIQILKTWNQINGKVQGRNISSIQSLLNYIYCDCNLPSPFAGIHLPFCAFFTKCKDHIIRSKTFDRSCSTNTFQAIRAIQCMTFHYQMGLGIKKLSHATKPNVTYLIFTNLFLPHRLYV